METRGYSGQRIELWNQILFRMPSIWGNKSFIYLILFLIISCEQKKEEIFGSVKDYIFEYRYINDSSIRKEDLNLDGVPDIVFSDFVLFGSGDGNFNEPQKKTDCKTAGNENSLNSIDLKRLNQDDILDFLCIEHSGVNNIKLTVFKGTVDGNFNYLSSSVPEIPYNIITDELYYQLRQLNFTKGITGDFNRDGFTDVVLPYFTYIPENLNYKRSIVVLLSGDDKGDFKYANFFETKPEFNLLTEVNDFNEDGEDDLLIYMSLISISIIYIPPISPSPLLYKNVRVPFDTLEVNTQEGLSSIYISNGDGTFTESFSYNGEIYIRNYDFNLDKKEDLIGKTMSQIELLINNGDGRFGEVPVVKMEDGGSILEILSEDFNGDGVLDIAYEKYYPDHEKGIPSLAVDILLNDGNGIFVQAGELIVTKEFKLPVKMVTGDFNCDGIRDMGLVYSKLNMGNGTVEILLGDGTGGFKNGYFYEVRGNPQLNILADDFSGDGGTDLIVKTEVTVNNQIRTNLSVLVTQCER